MNVSQGWIEKLLKGQILSWQEFIKLFHSLYKDSNSSGIINSEDLDKDFLRKFLELDPIVVIEATIKEIREYGIKAFRDMLMLAAPEVRMAIMGMLAAGIGLSREINLPILNE